MRRLAPVLDFLPACLVDLAFHVEFFVLQHLLYARLHARESPASFELALFAAVQPVVYILGCPLLGRASDGRGRARSASLGVAIFLAVPFFFLGDRLPDAAFYGAMAALGLAGALFWPAVQARLGERSGREGLGRALVRFNLGWTVGKAAAFKIAGRLFEDGRADAALGVSACAALLTLVLLRLDRDPPAREAGAAAHVPDPLPGEGAPAPLQAVKRGFLVAGLVTLVVAWGGQKTLFALVPELGLALGLRADAQGELLASLVLAQSVAFFAMARPARWAYRAGPLALLAPIVAVASAGVFFARGFTSALVPSLVLGVASGCAYTSSFFYSTDYDERRGFRMGVNEAAIGVGGLLPPFAGWIAERHGDVRIAWLVAAAFAALGGLVVVAALAWRDGGARPSAGGPG